ncbi:hypothetical protein HYH03_007976 [Edaphochlamys debaryana]|uniref:Glycerophosphocholine acyltransferase 1 n=1 Tax=Edaphochlamys debaryana TaxID=47281 RepID=A0A835Y1Y3_9CHLO|nr:hypothetical protein HYH03_007976 [Edaphochlamys debaryana]|eukprot:KAG2493754.1 hypothetical protein HYH03_007976 [Edaphochlamys debaryana]
MSSALKDKTGLSIHACAATQVPSDRPAAAADVVATRKDGKAPDTVLREVAKGLGSKADTLWFLGGSVVLCVLVALVAFAPGCLPLAFVIFGAICLPWRIVHFVQRKWIFYIVDFCYFANFAALGFLLLAPTDTRLEAVVYVLCEGPLAAALVVWRCAWLLGSHSHCISVLIHLLPGLALFAHRFLPTVAPEARESPLAMGCRLWSALASVPAPLEGPSPSAATAAAAAAAAGLSGIAGSAAAGAAGAGAGAAGGSGLAGAGGLLQGALGLVSEAGAGVAARLLAAADVARGRVPCPSGCGGGGEGVTGGTGGDGFCTAGTGAKSPYGLVCYARPATLGWQGAPAVPDPAWLWLAAAPLAFYLAWQLFYYVVVQVIFRRFILTHGYETSYIGLAKRAHKAKSPLNDFVRRGGTGRRIFMYGLLQLLFTLAAGVVGVVAYQSVGLAALWQAVKLLTPLYYGAEQQCQRLPASQLRMAAAKLAEAGLLDPRALGPQPPPAAADSGPAPSRAPEAGAQAAVAVVGAKSDNKSS